MAKKKTTKKKTRKTTSKKTSKKTSRKTGKKRSTKKKTTRKTTRRTRPTPSAAAAALAANAVRFDDFYADEIKIGRNARTRSERRLTRSAAMIVWREEDIDELVRDETGSVWGWSMRRYG